jgi:hypothetical protein
VVAELSPVTLHFEEEIYAHLYYSLQKISGCLTPQCVDNKIPAFEQITHYLLNLLNFPHEPTYLSPVVEKRKHKP